jgi:hypothetical protein
MSPLVIKLGPNGQVELELDSELLEDDSLELELLDSSPQ